MNKMMKKVRGLVVTTVGGLVMMINRVLAAPALDEVTKPMRNLQTLITTVAAGVGGVWMAISIFQFAFAFNQNDPSGKQSAIKGMISGGILLAAGTVLTFILS